MAAAATSPQVLLSCAFQPLCDALPQALLVLDGMSNICYANAVAEDLLGASLHVMATKPLSAFMRLDASWQELLAQTAKFHEGVKERGLFLARPRYGQVRVNAHARRAQVFQDAAQEGIILLLEAYDVSGKLDSHAARREAMRSAAVMADILAHEVRNPLAGIRGAAQLLSQTASAEDRELLALIRAEVDRIGGLLKQVECFSTDQELEAGAVNIHEVLRYVKGIVQPMAAHVSFIERYDPSLPAVRGNRERLVQALLNLVKNAAEVLEGREGAKIEFVTTYHSGYRVAGAALPICVQVRDNGPGVPELLREHIFDPFVTDKPAGKGLGLSIVAKIIADHGGVIALDAADADMTSFVLHLPMQHE